MPYSYVIDKTIEDVGTPTEPVTLQQAKDYCRISGSSEDTLITALITAAREAIERATGLCLVDKDVAITFCNDNGDFDFTIGPYKSDFVLKDEEDITIVADDYRLIGYQFPTLRAPAYSILKATYVAGYDTVPADLITAIKAQVNYFYESRGTTALDSLGFAPIVSVICQRWTRKSPVL